MFTQYLPIIAMSCVHNMLTRDVSKRTAGAHKLRDMSLLINYLSVQMAKHLHNRRVDVYIQLSSMSKMIQFSVCNAILSTLHSNYLDRMASTSRHNIVVSRGV